MGRKKKEQTVLKVSEETGVEASDLDRLPVEALEKLDALVPDKKPEGKVCVGRHPITKEPVYI